MAKPKPQNNDDLGTFVIGALLGSLAGAIAALWFAPRSGKETRHEINHQAAEIRENIEHVATDARRRVEGDSIDDSIQEGKAEARRFRQGLYQDQLPTN
ncbi:MAG: YtxH domain-containing protein [Chloroflexota bacterium]